MKSEKWHIICEKDVGLFSLIQQVISHVPLALAEDRVPFVHFGSRCCYWTEKGYADKSNVWEYYFEPAVEYEEEHFPKGLDEHIRANPPHFESAGYFWNKDIFVSNHFGHHRDFNDQSLRIPYKWEDPDTTVRLAASKIISTYVRPRTYLKNKIEEFFEANMSNRFVIGLHIRATDVNDLKTEYNIHRRYSYDPKAYLVEIEHVLKDNPKALIFVATDAQEALDLIIESFPGRTVSYSSIFHTGGEVSGKGAMGWGIPGYLTGDTEKAAKNGEEAIVDYLLLSRCQYFIHNGSGLARTVLLNNAELSHVNIHSRRKYLSHLFSLTNLELFYFLKIISKKGWWKLKSYLKQKVNK